MKQDEKGLDRVNQEKALEEELCAAGEEKAQEPECCGCTGKTKVRTEQEYRSLINRLNRIEGQIRGIKGMVERNVYCTDILVQVAAVTAALNGFGKLLLEDHIRTCVARDIREGHEETLDELMETLRRLIR